MRFLIAAICVVLFVALAGDPQVLHHSHSLPMPRQSLPLRPGMPPEVDRNLYGWGGAHDGFGNPVPPAANYRDASQTDPDLRYFFKR